MAATPPCTHNSKQLCTLTPLSRRPASTKWNLKEIISRSQRNELRGAQETTRAQAQAQRAEAQETGGGLELTVKPLPLPGYDRETRPRGAAPGSRFLRQGASHSHTLTGPRALDVLAELFVGLALPLRSAAYDEELRTTIQD